MTLRDKLKTFINIHKISISVVGVLLVFQFAFFWTPWWRHFVISAADLSQEESMNLPATVMRFGNLEKTRSFVKLLFEQMRDDGKSLQEIRSFIENSGIDCFDNNYYLKKKILPCQGLSYPSNTWSLEVNFDEKKVTQVSVKIWIDYL